MTHVKKKNLEPWLGSYSYSSIILINDCFIDAIQAMLHASGYANIKFHPILICMPENHYKWFPNKLTLL